MTNALDISLNFATSTDLDGRQTIMQGWGSGVGQNSTDAYFKSPFIIDINTGTLGGVNHTGELRLLLRGQSILDVSYSGTTYNYVRENVSVYYKWDLENAASGIYQSVYTIDREPPENSLVYHKDNSTLSYTVDGGYICKGLTVDGKLKVSYANVEYLYEKRGEDSYYEWLTASTSGIYQNVYTTDQDPAPGSVIYYRHSELIDGEYVTSYVEATGYSCTNFTEGSYGYNYLGGSLQSNTPYSIHIVKALNDTTVSWTLKNLNSEVETTGTFNKIYPTSDSAGVPIPVNLEKVNSLCFGTTLKKDKTGVSGISFLGSIDLATLRYAADNNSINVLSTTEYKTDTKDFVHFPYFPYHSYSAKNLKNMDNFKVLSETFEGSADSINFGYGDSSGFIGFSLSSKVNLKDMTNKKIYMKHLGSSTYCSLELLNKALVFTLNLQSGLTVALAWDIPESEQDVISSTPILVTIVSSGDSESSGSRYFKMYKNNELVASTARDNIVFLENPSTYFLSNAYTSLYAWTYEGTQEISLETNWKIIYTPNIYCPVFYSEKNNVIIRGTLLYAWKCIPNESTEIFIYTHSRNLKENTVLYNSDNSEYIGSDFELSDLYEEWVTKNVYTNTLEVQQNQSFLNADGSTYTENDFGTFKLYNVVYGSNPSTLAEYSQEYNTAAIIGGYSTTLYAWNYRAGDTRVYTTVRQPKQGDPLYNEDGSQYTPSSNAFHLEDSETYVVAHKVGNAYDQNTIVTHNKSEDVLTEHGMYVSDIISFNGPLSTNDLYYLTNITDTNF